MDHRISFVVLGLLLGACSMPTVGVEARYANLDAKGDVALATGGNPVARNSLSDVGLDGEEGSLGLRGDLKFGSPHLTVSTESASWSGDGTLTGSFGGIVVGTTVESDLDLAIHRAILTFDVLPVPMVELGLGLGVSVLDIQASLEDTNTSTVEEIDETVPVPELAARLAVEFWRMRVEALVGGMAYDAGGDRASYLDGDLNARVRLAGLGPVDGWLSVGYRMIGVDAEIEDGSDDIEIDTTFDGVYFGLRLSF